MSRAQRNEPAVAKRVAALSALRASWVSACAVCGAEIRASVPPVRGRHKRYCGPACKAAWDLAAHKEKRRTDERYRSNVNERANAANKLKREANPRTYPTRQCDECGSSYTQKNRRAMHCSQVCARKPEKRREKVKKRAISFAARPCKNCGQDYRPAVLAWTRYCSPTCREVWHSQDIAKKGKALRAARRAVRPARVCPPTKVARQREAANQPKPCRGCGETFQPSTGNQRYCAARCRRKSISTDGKRLRRARLKGVARKFIRALLVFERDAWICHICGQETLRSARGTNHPAAPEVDHIISLRDGGPHSYENVACAHRICNGRKGARSFYGQPAALPPAKSRVDFNNLLTIGQVKSSKSPH